MPNAGAFKKGEKRPKQGRPKGATNKFTKTVKEAVLAAFQDAQTDERHPSNLARFSKEYPEAFMSMASKMIPREVEAKLESSALTIVIQE
jgi:hypothetical protein